MCVCSCVVRRQKGTKTRGGGGVFGNEKCSLIKARQFFNDHQHSCARKVETFGAEVNGRIIFKKFKRILGAFCISKFKNSRLFQDGPSRMYFNARLY